MDQDSTTWTGVRTRGVERHMSLAWRCSTEQVVSDLERRTHAAAESTKDGRKPDHATGMLGASLTEGGSGKALSDRPALKPYRGKLAVRNFRGDRGNVRHGEAVTPPRNRKSGTGNPSPTAKRATILPDQPTSSHRKPAGGASHSRKVCPASWLQGLIPRS